MFLPFAVKTQDVRITQGQPGVGDPKTMLAPFGPHFSITLADLLAGTSYPAQQFADDDHKRMLAQVDLQLRGLVLTLVVGILGALFRRKQGAAALMVVGLAGLGNLISLAQQVEKLWARDAMLICDVCSWDQAWVEQGVRYHVGFWGLAILFSMLAILGLYTARHKTQRPL